MGALNSILDSHLADMDMEAPQDQTKTPKPTDSTPTVLRHKRVLNYDPRSPSDGLPRTPIIVAKTPSSSTSSSSPELVSASSIPDPRSPTFDFSRTPVVPTARPVGKVKVEDQKIKLKIKTQDKEGAASICNRLEDIQLNHSESGAQDLKVFVDDSDKSDQSENNKDSNTVSTERKCQLDETPKSQCVLKNRGKGLVEKRLGVLSMNTSQPRSPLSSLKDNSPRPQSNVQKHTAGVVRSNLLHDVTLDKENQVYHD